MLLDFIQLKNAFQLPKKTSYKLQKIFSKSREISKKSEKSLGRSQNKIVEAHEKDSRYLISLALEEKRIVSKKIRKFS